jgi:hypothetical protein
VTPLELEQGWSAIHGHDGVLYVITHFGKVQIHSQADGQFVGTLAPPAPMNWVRGRFFRLGGEGPWFALGYDGTAGRLEPVSGESWKRCPKLLTLFERAGCDGAIGVTTKGDLFYTASGEVHQVSHRVNSTPQVAAISRSGRYVALTESGVQRPTHCIVIDVDRREASCPVGQPWQLVEAGYWQKVCPKSLRHRFRFIEVGGREDLVLTSYRGQRLRLTVSDKHDQLELRSDDAGRKSTAEMLTFQKMAVPQAGFRLSVARWRDGSQAFLDSRGLLHLRSSSADVPEVSIVLTDGALAGWCADGRLWGRRYFTGARATALPRDVYASAIRAFVTRLT